MVTAPIFAFFPPVHIPFHAHHCLCKPPWGTRAAGDKGKGEKLKLLLLEEVAAEGGCVTDQLCTPPALLWGCWGSTRATGAELGQGGPCPEPGAAAGPAVGSLLCCALRYTSHIRPASYRSWHRGLFFLPSSLSFVQEQKG